MRIYHDEGQVRILASPSKDGKATYTGDQARALAAELIAAAQAADEYAVSVSHQAAVAVPNPHAALEPAAPSTTHFPHVVGNSATGTNENPAGATTLTVPAKKQDRKPRTAAQKAAAAKRRREARAKKEK